MPTTREVRAARRRRWADMVVIAASAAALVWGLYMIPAAGAEPLPPYRWITGVAGGLLGIGSVVYALRSTRGARVLLVLAALSLMVGFLVFPAFTADNILMLLLPALLMLAAIPLIGPMPTPEDEGEIR